MPYPPQWVAKISPSSSSSFSSPTKTSPRFDWRDPQRRKGVNNKVPTLEWQQPFCQIFCPLDRKKEVFCRALYGRMGFGMACGGSVYIGEKYGISFSRFSVPIWFRGGRGVIFTLSLSRFLPKMTGLLCGWAWMIIWKEFRSTDLELRHMISPQKPPTAFSWDGRVKNKGGFRKNNRHVHGLFFFWEAVCIFWHENGTEQRPLSHVRHSENGKILGGNLSPYFLNGHKRLEGQDTIHQFEGKWRLESVFRRGVNHGPIQRRRCIHSRSTIEHCRKYVFKRTDLSQPSQAGCFAKFYKVG